MANFDFTVKDNSAAVIAAVNEKVALALGLMGEVVEGYAKEDCPVDTGRLRNSLTHEHGPDGDSEYVGSDVEYAPYVEFGERYHHEVGKAHFLRDAATTHIDELRDVAQKTLKTISV